MDGGFSEYQPGQRDDDKSKKDKTAQRDKVIEAVIAAGAEFWRDPDGIAYVTLRRDGRIERYRVRSAAFRAVIRAIYAARYPRETDEGLLLPGSISDKAMSEAMPSLEAMVYRNGTDTRQPALRSTRIDDTIWIDLGTEDWSAVRVTKEGWEAVTGADIPLIRAEALRPLPRPNRAARRKAIATLRRLLNLGPDQDADFLLIVMWLLASLWPSGPYPILAIDGEQGSGKSTLCRLLRSLVDPNKAKLRAPPRTEADLVVAAAAGRVVALDNVSFLDADMADVLCRLATGAGLSKRRLYTDDDEHVVEVCRPILLNGISSLLARGDMADRALVVTLRRIADDQRRMEAEIEQAFAAAAPGILAALLDGLVEGLHFDRGVPAELPRMADFAALACRAAAAFGWTAAQVIDAIRSNRAAANETVVDADPLSDAIRMVLAEYGVPWDLGQRWSGTPTELLEKVNVMAPDTVKRERGWPKDAARLGSRLRRLAPALSRTGVDITEARVGRNRTRTITIEEKGGPDLPSAPSAPENSKGNQHDTADSATVRAPSADRPRPSASRPADSSAADADSMRTVPPSVEDAAKYREASQTDSADSKRPALSPPHADEVVL